jgi:hypothetical protein
MCFCACGALHLHVCMAWTLTFQGCHSTIDAIQLLGSVTMLRPLLLLQ